MSLVSGLETFVVGNPPPRQGGRYFILVRLTTDEGITGLGEAYVATFSPHLVAKMIADVAERHLIGQRPTDTEALFRRVYGNGYSLRPDPTLVGVLSSLEMACWDITGKEVGRPVYDLLGGVVNERLRTYTYLYPPGDEDAHSDHPVYRDPAAAAEAAADLVASGFTAIKFDPAGPYTIYDPHQPSLADLDRSEAMVRSVRDAVGGTVDLLFGTHGQFTASGAIRLARRLEPYDPLWFEEPCPPTRPEEMARVARSTSIPIAAGERLTTRWEFARLLDQGAASFLQPNLGRCGGIAEARKIASMAETHHALIAPHLYNGPVGAAANVHLSVSIPNFSILEGIGDGSGFASSLVTTKTRWSDGYLIPSTEPGLGIELNDEVALSNPYRGDALHLTVSEEPADGRTPET